jgi:CubicO group peptidase (beta-lactamase class C family)
MVIGPGSLQRLRVRQLARSTLILGLFLGLVPATPAQQTAGGKAVAIEDHPLERPTTPSNDLAGVVAQHPQVRALVVARGNCIAFEYYRKNISAETQSAVNSITKSVLSILVGIAIDEGFLRLDEKLSEVFPEEFDENVDPLAREITLRDLLTKTEGFEEGGWGHFKFGAGKSGKPQIWRWMLNRKVEYPPGTHFRYDGVGSDLLSIVLSTAIKQNLADFAKQRLFGPLHIENYTWHSDIEGYLLGEYGLYLTARGMAKIGLLYLRGGRWGETQLVSEKYVQDSTSKHNDGGPPVNAAYGYQWWVKETNPNAFFAAGLNGQLVLVVPKLDLVMAVSADYSPWGGRKYFSEVVLPAAAAELSRAAGSWNGSCPNPL